MVGWLHSRGRMIFPSLSDVPAVVFGKSARNCSFVISVVLIQKPSFTFALNAGEAEGVRLLPITKLPAGIHTRSICTSGVMVRRQVVSSLAACRAVAVCVSNGNPFTLTGRTGLVGFFISTVSPVVAPVMPSAFLFSFSQSA